MYQYIVVHRVVYLVLIKQLCEALGLIHCVLYGSTLNPNTQQLATRMPTLGTSPSTPVQKTGSHERFEQYVIANEIKDESKIAAMFLTTIGSKSYKVLRDLLAPAKLSQVKFHELVKTLKDHYEQKPIETERFQFHEREQGTVQPLRSVRSIVPLAQS